MEEQHDPTEGDWVSISGMQWVERGTASTTTSASTSSTVAMVRNTNVRLKRRQDALAHVWYRPGPKRTTVAERGGSSDHAHSPMNTRRIARTYSDTPWTFGTGQPTVTLFPQIRGKAGNQPHGHCRWDCRRSQRRPETDGYADVGTVMWKIEV